MEKMQPTMENNYWITTTTFIGNFKYIIVNK